MGQIGILVKSNDMYWQRLLTVYRSIRRRGCMSRGYLTRGYLTRGCLPRGVCIPACNGADTPPWTESHTGVKDLNTCNSWTGRQAFQQPGELWVSSFFRFQTVHYFFSQNKIGLFFTNDPYVDRRLCLANRFIKKPHKL